MFDAFETTIRDRKYRVTEAPSKTARGAIIRLANVLGPALGSITSLEGDASALILPLSQSVKPEDLEFFLEAFVWGRAVVIDGEKEPSITATSSEILFKGRTFDLIRLLAFAIKINCEDFLDMLGSLKNEGAKAKK